MGDEPQLCGLILTDKGVGMKQRKSQTALQNYLDGLLQEARVEQYQEEPRPVLLKEPTPEIRILPTLTAVPVPVQAEVVIEEAVAEPVNDLPAWSGESFECLLFSVAGLTLAVPLQCLGSIYPLNGDQVTPLFGQPEWFVGLLPTPAGNIKVLDTARWVMPERYVDELRERFKFVISIDGHDWGLAVDEVRESVFLQPDAVKWRAQRKSRPWLAGTVIEHMCALLDVDALAQLVSARQPVAAGTR